MNNTQRLEQLRAATADAIERHSAHLAELKKIAGQPAQIGHVFLFPNSTDIDLHWVVIASHPDKPLLFAVPTDGNSLVGLTDVVISCPALGPRVMRCGYGLWIHRDDFHLHLRVDVLDKRHIQRAKGKLQEIGSGDIRGSASHRETEANPDYEDWLSEIERAVDRLARSLRVRDVTIKSADFVRTVELPGLAASPTDAESHYTMAAWSGGALARLLESYQQEIGKGLLVRQIDLLYPGALFLVLEADGVAAVYLPEAKQPPPHVYVIDASGQELQGVWNTTPKGTGARAFFPWTTDRIRFRFGHGVQALEIIVEK
jgi:hypothetical protein